jgi:hypothetical protein
MAIIGKSPSGVNPMAANGQPLDCSANLDKSDKYLYDLLAESPKVKRIKP